MAEVNFIKHYIEANARLYNEKDFNSTHIALYNALFQLWNYCGFQEDLSVNRHDVMNLAKIGSVNTYLKCLKDLDKKEYLKYKPSHNPLKGSIINLFRFDTTTEQVVNKYRTSSDTTTDTTCDTSSETLYKLLKPLNHKTIKLIKQYPNFINENLEDILIKKFPDDFKKQENKKEKKVAPKKEKSSFEKAIDDNILENLYTDLKQSNQHFINLRRDIDMSYGHKLSSKEVLEWVDRFWLTKSQTIEDTMTTKKLRDYFGNWLKKQIEKKKQTTSHSGNTWD